MSKIQDVPFITKVIDTLSDELKSGLYDLIDGQVKTPVFRSLVNNDYAITEANDKGKVQFVTLETLRGNYTGYLAYNSVYCVLIAFKGNTQALDMLNINVAKHTFAFVNESLSILELRVELEDGKEGVTPTDLGVTNNNIHLAKGTTQIGEGINLKTLDGNTLIGSGNVGFKTINDQEIVGDGNIVVGEGGTITIDTAFDETSTNAVQNKVIAKFANEVVENKADKSEVSEVANDLRTTKTRVSAVERAVGLLEEESLNLSEVLDIVDAGLAKNYFKAGDQFHVSWKENDTTTHNIDHDVVDLEDVIVLENGEEVTKHALTLQWHFSMTDVLFDNAEFMAKTKTTMPAGTYHFKVQHDSWGGNNGKTYQFTATSDIPAGSFLRPTNNYDQSMAGKNMNVYADWGDTTATASYAISEGSDGVDLGTMSSKTEQGQASTYLEACEEKGGIYLNDYQAVVFGDNNYYYSYVRQYLNATTTGFFTQQHIFDRPPSDWSTKRGFLAGYDDEFISAIKSTKRVVSSNTLVYGGVNYTMYDKIFLPTMANMNVDGFSTVQNTGGIEGNAYEYYKELAVGQSNLNPNGTFKVYETYAILKKYNYKNKSNVVYYWTSSALRSGTAHSLDVRSSGLVSNDGAANRGAVSPAFNLVK